MTTKKIILADKKVNEIEKGTVLRGLSDLFMVVEVVREFNENPIHSALFSDGVTGSTNRYMHGSGRRIEGKFALASLTTGSNFFCSQDSLTDLLRKISNHGKFTIVDGIEFKEI